MYQFLRNYHFVSYEIIYYGVFWLKLSLSSSCTVIYESDVNILKED